MKFKVGIAPYVCSTKKNREDAGLDTQEAWAVISSERGEIVRMVKRVPRCAVKKVNDAPGRFILLTPEACRFLHVNVGDTVDVAPSETTFDCP